MMTWLNDKSELIIALSKMHNIGNAKITELFNLFIKDSDDLDDICRKLPQSINSQEIIDATKADLEYAKQHGIKICTIADKEFPNLANINAPKADKPTILYYIGDISLLNKTNNNISIIGTRDPDEVGQKACESLAQNISQLGFTIVSGFAKGCDIIAHNTALKYGTKTIAILPTPPNNPKINLETAHEIIATGGLLISEYLYPDKSKTEYSRNCVKRDKLVAMFCKGLILACGKTQSGSAITIDYAKKYGTNIYVLKPQDNSLNQEMFSLNYDLLSKNPGDIKAINFDNQYNMDMSFLDKPQEKLSLL